MFTGIIEATGTVLQKTADSLTIERPASFDDLKKGCSVAVSGACLTVVAFDKKSMTFNVIPETWKKTKLGSLKKGDQVNLERAMKVGDRFDGHIVQGHIEGVGEVKRVKRKEKSYEITFHASLLDQYIISKGSITLDGVALTVASIEKNQITVALIPETLQVTTLGSLKKGDQVNIETDIVGKYIHAFFARTRKSTGKKHKRALHIL